MIPSLPPRSSRRLSLSNSKALRSSSKPPKTTSNHHPPITAKLPPSFKLSTPVPQQTNDGKTFTTNKLTRQNSIFKGLEVMNGEIIPSNRLEFMSSSDSTPTTHKYSNGKVNLAASDYSNSSIRKRRSSRRLSSPLVTTPTNGGSIRVMEKEKVLLVGSESISTGRTSGTPKIYDKPFVDVTNQTEESPRPIYSHSSPFGRRKSLIHVKSSVGGLSIPSNNRDDAVVPTVSSFSSTSSKEEDDSNMDTSSMDIEEDEDDLSPPKGSICLAEDYADDEEEQTPFEEGKKKQEDSPSLQEILEDTPTRTLQEVLEDSSPELTLKEILDDSPTPQKGDLAFLHESSMEDETIDLKQVMDMENDEAPLSGTKRSRRQTLEGKASNGIAMCSHDDDINSRSRKKSRQSFVVPNISLEKDEMNMPLSALCRTAKQDGVSRSKKSRQSIIVPNIVVYEDDSQEENVDDDMNKPLSSLCHEKLKEEAVDQNNDVGKKMTEEEKMERVRNAVRSLCAVPSDERYKSKDAALIEDLTGYPILSTIDRKRRDFEKKKNRKMKPEEFARAKHNSKRNIINGMGALVKNMERRKKRQDSVLEQGTGCRVEKKKGRYRYFNIESGERISSKKYQGLYLSRIKENRNMEKKSPKETKEYKLLKNDQRHGDFKARNKEERGTTINTEHNKGTCDRSHPVTVPALPEKEIAVEQCPFPCRDDIPSDPELAAAQEKLFATFDSALEEYSREIMRINAKRQQEKS